MGTNVSHIARFACIIYATLTTLICSAKEYTSISELPHVGNVYTLSEDDVCTISGDYILSAEKTLIVLGTLNFQKSFTNKGTTTIAEGASVTVANSFTSNTNTSNLTINGTISANTLNVANVVTQGGHSQLNITESITNAATLLIPNEITLTKGITNSGTLTIPENKKVTISGKFTNSGTTTISENATVTVVNNTLENTATGTVNIEGTVTTKDFINKGIITIDKDASVAATNGFTSNATTSNLTTNGTISAKTLNVANIVTQGKYSQLNITESITNAATLLIPNDITLTKGITNSGTLTIQEGKIVTLTGTLENKATGTLNINGTSKCNNFTNNGTATIAEGANIAVTNTFSSNDATNSNLNLDGTISAKTLNVANIVTQGEHSQLNITASITNNANTLKIPNNITLTGGITNSGTLELSDNITVTTNGDIKNNGTLTIPSKSTLDASKKALENTATGILNIDGNIKVNNFKTNGTITADDDATITSTTLTNNGTLTLPTDYNLTFTNVTNNGTLTIPEGKTLNIPGTFENTATGTLNINGNVKTKDFKTNGTITADDDAIVTVSSTLTNNGTLTLPANYNLTFTNVTNNGMLTIPEGKNLNIPGTLSNNGTLELSDKVTVTIKSDVKNKGTITIPSNATLDASVSKKNFENFETGTIINNGTILTYNLWNTGNIELISIDDGFANIQASHFYANVAKEQQNNTAYAGAQGRLYISNGVLSVQFRFLVGDDVTILKDAGVIIDGDQTSYLLIYDMQHSSSAKNWLTVLNNSKLEIILGNDNNNGVAPGTAAFDDNPMQWEFVESPVMAGIDCENDLLDAPDGYNYYKVIPDIEIAGIGLSSSCLYFKVPQNIHIVGDVHRGGVTNTNEHSKDVGIVSINKGETTIDKTLAILLPILLTNFDVQQNGQAIEFNWTTASEINNDYFEIEYSYDGKNFNPLVWTEGAGTTTKEHDYSITVNNINDITGLVYFRLKQTDFDGKSSYSDVKILQINSYEENLFIYPNPANTTITIAGEYESVRFVDMQSRTISLPCIGKAMYSVENLFNGTYFAIISIKGGTKVLMFIKD